MSGALMKMLGGGSESDSLMSGQEQGGEFPKSEGYLSGLMSDTEEIAKDNPDQFINQRMAMSQAGLEQQPHAPPGPGYTGLQGLMQMIGQPQRNPKQKSNILQGLMGDM